MTYPKEFFMIRLTTRIIDYAKPGNRGSFVRGSELRRFGIDIKPSGTRTSIIQYPNIKGRTRRWVISQ